MIAEMDSSWTLYLEDSDPFRLPPILVCLVIEDLRSQDVVGVNCFHGLHLISPVSRRFDWGGKSVGLVGPSEDRHWMHGSSPGVLGELHGS